MFIRYLIIICFTLIYPSFADLNSTILDEYHNEVCDWLIDTSNDIDDYFIESNESIIRSSTYAEIKISSAIESSRQSEHALRLRLRLHLPKIQKKLRLILEDEDSDDLSYDGTVLNNEYQLENKNYFLRLEYFNYIKKKLHLTAGAGIRFRKSSLHPYLNIRSKYYTEDNNQYRSLLFNRFRLYINSDIENTLGFDKFQHINNKTYTLFRNTLSYKSWEDDKKIVNAFSINHHLDQDRRFVAGISMVNQWDATEIELDYVQLYGLYRDRLYKNWIYYELNPSLLWREENDYDMSARFMVNIGMKFKSH